MKYVILGVNNLGSLGVQALAVSAIKNIKSVDQNARIILPLNDITPIASALQPMLDSVRVIPYKGGIRSYLRMILAMVILILKRIGIKPTYFQNKSTIIDGLIDSDMVLCLLQDALLYADTKVSLIRNLYALQFVILSLLMDKRVAVLSFSCIKTHNTFSRKLVKYILSKCSFLVVRDRVSKDTLDWMGIKVPTLVAPDISVSFTGKKPDNELIITGVINRPLIGINPSGLLCFGYAQHKPIKNYTRIMADLIDSIVSQIDCQIVLIPHEFTNTIHNDYVAAKAIRDETRNRDHVYLIENIKDAEQIKYYIGLCDLLIAGRMHAGIAALSQGIPCIFMAYSQKFLFIDDWFHLKDCIITTEDLSREKLIKLVNRVWEDRVEIKAKILSGIPVIQAISRDMWIKLLNINRD